MDDVDARNGLEEEDIILNIEYLVLGKFRAGERDVKGFDATRWVPLTELENELGQEDLDEALNEFEAGLGTARETALARARADKERQEREAGDG
tara:strand:+ start:544 stop:825 length:282 start_codon:yes stop_codon:yes gene_type:complete